MQIYNTHVFDFFIYFSFIKKKMFSMDSKDILMG
jgi:hypothetical protein